MTQADASPPPVALDDLPETLTSADVARVLKTTTRTVRRLVVRNELPQPSRFGRLVRWSRESIRAALLAAAL